MQTVCQLFALSWRSRKTEQFSPANRRHRSVVAQSRTAARPVHGCLAQARIGFRLGQALASHQQALGPVNDLSLLQLGAGISQPARSCSSCSKRAMATSITGLMLSEECPPPHKPTRLRQWPQYMGGVLLIREQHDGAALIARRNHHMLQDVASLRFRIDHDHVGLNLGNPLGQNASPAGRHHVVA